MVIGIDNILRRVLCIGAQICKQKRSYICCEKLFWVGCIPTGSVIIQGDRKSVV